MLATAGEVVVAAAAAAVVVVAVIDISLIFLPSVGLKNSSSRDISNATGFIPLSGLSGLAIQEGVVNAHVWPKKKDPRKITLFRTGNTRNNWPGHHGTYCNMKALKIKFLSELRSSSPFRPSGLGAPYGCEIFFVLFVEVAATTTVTGVAVGILFFLLVSCCCCFGGWTRIVASVFWTTESVADFDAPQPIQIIIMRRRKRLGGEL